MFSKLNNHFSISDIDTHIDNDMENNTDNDIDNDIDTGINIDSETDIKIDINKYKIANKDAIKELNDILQLKIFLDPNGITKMDIIKQETIKDIFVNDIRVFENISKIRLSGYTYIFWWNGNLSNIIKTGDCVDVTFNHMQIENTKFIQLWIVRIMI